MVMTRKIVCDDIFTDIMNIINKHDFISGKSDLFQVVLTHFFKKYIDGRLRWPLFFKSSVVHTVARRTPLCAWFRAATVLCMHILMMHTIHHHTVQYTAV
jgi:hypothetical protein